MCFLQPRVRGNPDRTQGRAFTLIEVLVAVAVIALLVAILIPSLNRARKAAVSATCLSNLRQFVLAAQGYTNLYHGRFPIAQYQVKGASSAPDIWYGWDFQTIKDKVNHCFISKPGLLWAAQANTEIHQCPAFEGGANAPGGWTGPSGQPTERYTGYNYNTDYIGHGQGEIGQADVAVLPPAAVTDVRRPGECAFFGDGQYLSGANKHMRAPLNDVEHGGVYFEGRTAGTQGYRHLGKTNVAFGDGHACSWSKRYTENDDRMEPAPETGFLSPDNSMYDLK